MGAAASKSGDAGCSSDVAALQRQVKDLKLQLSAAQKGGGGGGGRANGSGGFADVLFFPDPAMPCHYMDNCRRQNCTFAHSPTSLTKLLSVLRGAQRTLDVCVFTITCDEIADALLQAHQRGVKVRVISDNDQATSQGSDIGKFIQAGIPLKTDADQAHMHHKFAIVDKCLVLNGSFNWTRQAVLQNQENCVVTDEPRLVNLFGNQFESLWSKYRLAGRV